MQPEGHRVEEAVEEPDAAVLIVADGPVAQTGQGGSARGEDAGRAQHARGVDTAPGSWVAVRSVQHHDACPQPDGQVAQCRVQRVADPSAAMQQLKDKDCPGAVRGLAPARRSASRSELRSQPSRSSQAARSPCQATNRVVANGELIAGSACWAAAGGSPAWPLPLRIRFLHGGVSLWLDPEENPLRSSLILRVSPRCTCPWRDRLRNWPTALDPDSDSRQRRGDRR